jgi:hypothetical protein
MKKKANVTIPEHVMRELNAWGLHLIHRTDGARLFDVECACGVFMFATPSWDVMLLVMRIHRTHFCPYTKHLRKEAVS